MWDKIVGTLLKPISDLASEFIEDKDKRNEFVARLQGKLIDQKTAFMTAARDVIIAETNSKSWMARNWRPLTMLTFVAIIANNYIIAPYLTVFGVPNIILEIPPDMWDLIKLGMTGYIVGRTVEETTKGLTGGGGLREVARNVLGKGN